MTHLFLHLCSHGTILILCHRQVLHNSVCVKDFDYVDNFLENSIIVGESWDKGVKKREDCASFCV